MRLLPLLFLLTACPAPKDTSDTGPEADADIDADADPRDGTYTGSFSLDVVAPQNAAITDVCTGSSNLVYDSTQAGNEVSGTVSCTWGGVMANSIDGNGDVYGRSNGDGTLTGSMMIGTNLPAVWNGQWGDLDQLQGTAEGTFAASTTEGPLQVNYTIAFTATR